jgi:hypothetical protein
MNKLKIALRVHLRDRPFDFYVAFVLFMLGLWAFVDPSWPERYTEDGNLYFLMMFIMVYLMVAAGFIMASLLCKRQKHPVLALMGEMYGWFFIAAAALATSTIYLVAFYNGVQSFAVWAVWFVIWIGLFLASAVRGIDLFYFYRSLKI